MFDLFLLQGKKVSVGGLLRLLAHFPDSWSWPEVQLIQAAVYLTERRRCIITIGFFAL